MKKTVFALSLFLLLLVPAVHAADMTDLLKALPSIPTGGSAQESGTVASGLKEALSVGTKNAVNALSTTNGYFGNQAVKILLPENVRRVGEVARLSRLDVHFNGCSFFTRQQSGGFVGAHGQTHLSHPGFAFLLGDVAADEDQIAGACKGHISSGGDGHRGQFNAHCLQTTLGC